MAKRIEEYDNGWFVLKRGRSYYAGTPEKEMIEPDEGFHYLRVRRSARLFAALCVKLGRLPLLDDPEIVPVSVAAAGKAEIAAYLCALHRTHYTPSSEYRPVLIGEQLGIADDTVPEYCRRVLRSVDDKRVLCDIGYRY